MASSAPPVTIVIFGGSGDLTERKLIPALFSNYLKGRLPAEFMIVAFARTRYTHEQYREHLLNERDVAEEEWHNFARRIFYVVGQYDRRESYDELQAFLREHEPASSGRIYYLAAIPKLFATIARYLGEAGMADGRQGGFRRIIVEKPYGFDLDSARTLDEAVHAAFREDQVYRIDHYLGKETAQNILFFRFANTIFEPVWNRNYVDNIQITVEEEVDVGRRGSYYDQTGVLLDMFQNHLLQLLTLVTMEPPATFQADAVRNEKVKVLSAIRPIPLADTLRAQYAGYRQANGVQPDSQTVTYAAIKLYIDNWRWSGVPCYLRSGKALARKASEIIIEFKYPPQRLFDRRAFTPNLLSLCIQPDESIHLKFETKVPDSMQDTRPVDMEFHYRNQFAGQSMPDAYERLLLDVIHGDASLFPRNDAIEQAWRLIDPIIRGWQTPEAPPLHIYDRGSWGPIEVHDFLLRDERYWRVGCDCGKNAECE